MLAAYLLVSAEVFLATAVGGAFRMSFVRVGPTELRLLLSGGALALIRWPTCELPGIGRVLVLDVAGILAIAGLLDRTGRLGADDGPALYVAEPRRR